VTDQTRTAVVSGAARGVRAAIANPLSNDGFAVAVLDLDETTCKPVVAEIKASGAGRCPSASRWPTNKRWQASWAE
jgi:3-oxoacyl-[acyl-carrier protein] reductase